MRFALALALAVAAASCNRTPSSTPAPQSSPVAPPAESVAPPAESPVPSAKPDANALDQSKGLPPWTFEGFPGWLGFATSVERSLEMSPRHPEHEIAIADEPRWGPGNLRATIGGFSEVVSFAAQEEVDFGCDGGRARFAFFSASKRLPPGPVWLTPHETSAVVTPVVEIPKEKIPAKIATTGEKELRAWSAGPHTFVSRRTDTTLVSEVWEGETQTLRDASKYISMHGADDIAPGLEGGPGVPIPRLRIDVEGKSLLLVETNGFEGSGFVGVLLEKGAAKRAEGRPYLYWCAF